MSENILKVTIGNISIELQGQSDFVYSIFNDIRTNGFGEISSNYLQSPALESNGLTLNSENNSASSKVERTENNVLTHNNELPSIKDLVMKNPFPTEADWIIVYGFYASEQGNKPFTQETIKQWYKDTNRETSSRNKNFSTNIKKLIKNGFISYLNEKDLTITVQGQDKARQLIFAPNEGTKRQRNSAAKSYTENSFNIIELNFTSEQKKTIKNTYAKFPKLTNMDKMVFAAYFISTLNKTDSISPNHAYTILKIAGVSTAFDILSALKNARNKNYFSSGEEKGTFKLTSYGLDRYEDLNNAK